MSQTVILGALELGGIFAVLSLGLYISYKVLNIPDLTVDGSFTLGTAVSAMFTINAMPYLGILASFLIGAVAGMVTGLLITKLKIMPLLSGILTFLIAFTIVLGLTTMISSTMDIQLSSIKYMYICGSAYFFVGIILLIMNAFLKRTSDY